MELSALGRHCALESCHRLDFLPFQCDRCQLQFCLDHRTSASHSCTAPPPPQRQPASLSPLLHLNPHRCCAAHCRQREAQANTCRNCGQNFCLRHRFPTQHECSAKMGNVIRKQGQLIPQHSTLLSTVPELGAAEQGAQAAAGCGEESRQAERRRNTNVAQSRLLQQAQKA